MLINRERFFKGFRANFERRLTPKKVDALNFLLNGFEYKYTGVYPDRMPIDSIAYMLATTYHETNRKMLPRKEIRQRIYGEGAVRRRRIAFRKHQDRYWLSGFYGRGYVQITWMANYKKFGIEGSPETALNPHMAFEILFKGMTEGMFTGRKLNHYIRPDHTDFLYARKVVNGMDDAGLIADYATKFAKILTEAV